MSKSLPVFVIEKPKMWYSTRCKECHTLQKREITIDRFHCHNHKCVAHKKGYMQNPGKGNTQHYLDSLLNLLQKHNEVIVQSNGAYVSHAKLILARITSERPIGLPIAEFIQHKELIKLVRDKIFCGKCKRNFYEDLDGEPVTECIFCKSKQIPTREDRELWVYQWTLRLIGAIV